MNLYSFPTTLHEFMFSDFVFLIVGLFFGGLLPSRPPASSWRGPPLQLASGVLNSSGRTNEGNRHCESGLGNLPLQKSGRGSNCQTGRPGGRSPQVKHGKTGERAFRPPYILNLLLFRSFSNLMARPMNLNNHYFSSV